MGESVRSQYRIPKELNDWLTARARSEERSKNAQLVVELRARMRESTTRTQTDSVTEPKPNRPG
ncbi:Arc-like DNA binding domain protein (plasmid) [Caballeronia sp. S22]